MSVERDENYVPRTRRDYSLPSESTATPADYHEIFEETPIYTLLRMLLMQVVGWQYYLCSNVMGSPMYPPGTNVSWIHREFIWRSNLSISTFSLPRLFLNPTSGMELSPPISVSLSCYSSSIFGLKKLAPWIWSSSTLSPTWYVLTRSMKVHLYHFSQFANHWVVMLTYLHHSDPTIPHYRSKEWNFLRGAISTVDRPLLGWVGRFFLHNVSHDHVSGVLRSSSRPHVPCR